MVASRAGRHAAPRSALVRRASASPARHAAAPPPARRALSAAVGALAGATLAAGAITVLGQTGSSRLPGPLHEAAVDLAGQRPSAADWGALQERRTAEADRALEGPAMRVERRLLLRRLEARDRSASRSGSRAERVTGPEARRSDQRPAHRPQGRADDPRARSEADRRSERRAVRVRHETGHVRRGAAGAASSEGGNEWRLPVSAGGYHLTARFGECSSLWASCHTGLDFAALSGTPVHNVADGAVSETGWAGAYGERTVVTLDDGTEIWFCHQSSIQVSPGQRVAAGQVIGTVGSTGNTTGAHLHLEVRPGGGDPVDPYAALLAHGAHP